MPEHEPSMRSVEPDRLYEERAYVAFARPIIQGDVFDNVVLPDGSDPQTVQIVGHPCTTRHGSRITVAPVHPYMRVPQEKWNGHLRVMPLDDVHEDGRSYATQFEAVTSVPSASLTRDMRIASLSDLGIYVLQQRLVKHYTRLTVDIDTLRVQSSPVLAEAELERDWIEEIAGEQVTESAAEELSQGFATWLDQDDGRRRQQLQREEEHTDLRREARNEAKQRARQSLG